MDAINKHIKFDMKAYVHDLCGFVQGESSIGDNAPKDYPVTTYESVIVDNADLIEAFYAKYLEKSKHAPKQCIDSLKLDFANKFLDMVERST